MASTNAVIRAALQLKFTQFASESDERIDAFLDDARLLVPLCSIPADRQDLALMYKAASMLVGVDSTSASGTVKKEKSGDIEIEYATGSTGAISTNNFEQMYNSLVRPFSRNSPFVLGRRA